MLDPFRPTIRTLSFLGKELAEILRQPRLIFGLILSPFLILLLVGLGFQQEPLTFRTLFVVAPNSPMKPLVEEYGRSISPQLIYTGTSEDLEAALTRLRRGQVDLVIQAPQDPMQDLNKHEKATFTFYNAEVDPFQDSYVDYFGQVFVAEVNRRFLEDAAEQSQQETVSVESHVQMSKRSASAFREALERGDRSAARLHRLELLRRLDTLERLLAVTASIAAAAPTTNPGEGESNAVVSIGRLRAQVPQIDDAGQDDEDLRQQAAQAAQIEQGLTTLEGEIEALQDVPADLLISPFRSQTENVSPVEPDVTHYFVGPVIALLLQHLSVTFAALSIVRDRQLGTMELFQISPLRPGELLIGKYLSHFLLAATIALVLTLLTIFGLGVPMLGSWLDYVGVIAAVAFASVGIGFLLSLVSESDSQAVQYSMIVLLASVFFTGFFIRLEALWWPVRTLSWLLPATYGILMLQDVMLRGLPLSGVAIGGLVAVGALVMLVGFFLAHSRMRPA